MKTYNGHRSWNAWNVSLWLLNDENLYQTYETYKKSYGQKKAISCMVRDLKGQKTPDGAVYNSLSIKLALKEDN